MKNKYNYKLTIHRSNKHFYIMLVDISNSPSRILKTFSTMKKSHSNLESIFTLIPEIKEYMKSNGIDIALFERNGFRFEKNLRSLASELRNHNLIK